MARKTPQEVGALSQRDVQDLLGNQSTPKKIEIIDKLAAHYDGGALSENQIEVAQKIFQLLTKEAETEVRRALSENLQHSNIPKETALALAKDVSEVSCPILAFSEVLGEAELLDILKSTDGEAQLIAVAGRRNVPEKVSDTLIDSGKEKVVGNLLNNRTAQIRDDSYDKVLERFSGSQNIVESMVTRGSLSSRIIQKMTRVVSEQIKERISAKYRHDFEEISKYFAKSAEIAAINFEGLQGVDKELVYLIERLEKNSRLEEALSQTHGRLVYLLSRMENASRITPLSVLAQGYLTLFCVMLSRRAQVSYANVLKLMEEEKSFRKLYEKAKLPAAMFATTCFTIRILEKMDSEAEENKSPRAYEDLALMLRYMTHESGDRDIENIDRFIAIINHHVERQGGKVA